jgi:serine/threonine protein phosphatase PrpC
VPALRYETAEISLIGDREQNQDRVVIMCGDAGALLAVFDGMGGHADGERAAEVARDAVRASFEQEADHLHDPTGFLHRTVLAAHDAVVALGVGQSVEHKPRATCAICLIHQERAWWAHVGDARIYLLRNSAVVERTRDHSHVEVLLREGLISEDEIAGHPMRHYVECCLGGESALPDLSIPNFRGLQQGDVLLVCSDGLWSGLADDVIATSCNERVPISEWIGRLSERAIAGNAPYSDNTSVAALRMLAG